MENISTVVIVIHLMVVLALVIVVLLQRSEGGALGMGGGGGGMMSARGAANALTTTTGVLAAAFFVTSLTLAFLSKLESDPSDLLDNIETNQTQPADGSAPSSEVPNLLPTIPQAPKSNVPDGN